MAFGGSNLAEAIQRTLTPCLQERQVLGKDEALEKVRQIGGGCVSDAFHCTSSTGKEVFVKVCRASPGQSLEEVREMFAAEEIGLRALADTKTIRVPVPYASGVLSDGSCAFLAMEYLQLGGGSRGNIQQKLGEKLADLHLVRGSDQFGFEINNTIGSTFQDNTWTSDWVEFLRRRLSYQFDLATRGGRNPQLKKMGQQLLDRLDSYFEGIEVRPSLLHGDLWSGNWAADANTGEPVVLDPAPYWGHHEADLGIMKLFGGIGPAFYEAYHKKLPKQPGYDKRISIYALYHAVNHLNMFGSSYLSTSISFLSDALQQ